MTTIVHKTREEWLTAASYALGAHFFPLEEGARLPEKMACSCGFPWKSKDAIGQCFSPEASADGTTHLFVCPTQDEPVRVLDILLHELGHAALGVKEKHGRKFRAFCQSVGLAGKPTATIAEPGSELHATLSRMAEELGPYPHKAVIKKIGGKEKKKGNGGWVRMQSQSEEDYRITISPKQLEAHGAPRDPWDDQMVPVEEGE